MPIALLNGRVLREQALVEGQCVLLEGGRILDIVPHGHPACRGATQIDLRGNMLLPGFIDSQVNGGGGVLFNDSPTVETIRQIGRAHRHFGTTGFMPTLISADLDVVARAIAATRAAIEAGVPGVLGIHIEGPFLNVERKGVHDPAKLRELDSSAVGLLTSLGIGRTLVTLAPEMTKPQIIRKLTAAGVIVSAGHTNATYAEVVAALQHGLTGFTHLFNAMSQPGAREPGMVGAALDSATAAAGIIVDGVHVHPAAIRLAFAALGPARLLLVSDAMPTVGDAGADGFLLNGQRIRLAAGRLTDAAGTLAGAHLSMAEAVRNAVQRVGLPRTAALRMATATPAHWLGLADRGRIVPGARADLVALDADLRVVAVWQEGAPLDL